jgi:hypothetical protein
MEPAPLPFPAVWAAHTLAMVIRRKTPAMDPQRPQPDMNSASVATLELDLGAAALTVFGPLLQQGVFVSILQGATVRSFLCLDLALAADFVEERISTIFLNGKPVDTLEARLRDGDVLALSAAMPGLVGATMRRGGVVAKLRSNISHREAAHHEEGGPAGIILVKLFNTLIPALGLRLLERGVLVERDTLKETLQKGDFWDHCPRATLRGQEVAISPPGGFPWPEPETWIDLRVGRAARRCHQE